MQSKQWAIILLTVSIYTALSLICIRAFWRASSSKEKNRYYLAAKFFAVALAAISAIVMPVHVPLAGVEQFWQGMIWFILVFPVSLPAGYWVAWMSDQILTKVDDS